MKYFRIRQDSSIGERWTLGDINHVDNWLFIDPPVNFMEPGSYSLSVKRFGAKVDYSLAGYASVPVVSRKFRDALFGLPEIDQPHMNVVFESVVVDGQGTAPEYFVMIVETKKHCVDQALSDFVLFEKNDPIRPDLAGQYRGFMKLVIDDEKADSSHIFRLEKFSTALIVSEEVKRRLDNVGVVGAIYDPIN